MAKIYDILEIAGVEPLAANPTPAFKGRMYFNTVSSEVRVYDGTTWIPIGSGGSGGTGWTLVGTHAAPTLITAVGGITPGNYRQQVIFIAGNGGVPIDISANPQIAAGTTDGDSLELVGCSDVATVLVEDGTGVVLNGAWLAEDNKVLNLRWDAALAKWRERSRS